MTLPRLLNQSPEFHTGSSEPLREPVDRPLLASETGRELSPGEALNALLVLQSRMFRKLSDRHAGESVVSPRRETR